MTYRHGTWNEDGNGVGIKGDQGPLWEWGKKWQFKKYKKNSYKASLILF